MVIRSEILDFINRKETTGALLLTGQWGCGKTYLVKSIAKELNEGKKYAVAVISLFGLDSVSAINKRVKEAYTDFLLGSYGKTAKKVSKALTTIAKDGMSVASAATNGMPGLSAASQGLSAVMSYDLFGFIDVKNTIAKGDKERKFILVFDDLERNNLVIKDLLGAINEFVENKNIKVIIIADQEQIDRDDYNEYKEKLISRTIRMSSDYEQLIDCIIEEYTETATGYKQFLTANSILLKQVFAESKSDNLRTFKTILADFERMYEAWVGTDIPTDNMKWVLYTFAAEMFISKMPKKDKPDHGKQNALYHLEKNDDGYEHKGNNRSSFSTFSGWINNGSWEKDRFIEELEDRYAEADVPPVVRFLHYYFWSLQQADIDEGLPQALKLAYEGELSRDNLIYLLTKVHYLKSYSVTLPCEIDYAAIKAGLLKRIHGIKYRTIDEPNSHTFATPDQLDPEAHQIYELIDSIEDRMVSWDNRALYIEYLHGRDGVSQSSVRNLFIDEFDDDLLAIFQDVYRCADNSGKQDYARSLLKLIFDGDNYSDEENIQKTKQNFNILIEWLSAQSSDDAITMLIHKSFIESIQKSEIMSK